MLPLMLDRSFATLRMTRRAAESNGILKAIAVRKASPTAAFCTIVILSVAKDLLAVAVSMPVASDVKRAPGDFVKDFMPRLCIDLLLWPYMSRPLEKGRRVAPDRNAPKAHAQQ